MAHDIDHFVDSEEFGGMSVEEIIARRNTRSALPDQQVAHAAARVDKSGTVAKLNEWRRQDTVHRGLGGRPVQIGDRAILTGMLLLAQEHTPLWMTSLSELLLHRLSPTSQDLLALPAAHGPRVNPLIEQNRWEKNTNNSFHRILDLMDPYPMISRRYSLTYAETQELLANHDAARSQVMKERLDEFTNLFLTMTFMEQPRHLRRATKKIDVSFDQTYVKPPTKKGFSKKKLAKRVADEKQAQEENRALIEGPVDPFAGWYPKQGDRPDLARGTNDTTGPEDSSSKGFSDLAWGWVANIAVRVDSESPKSNRFPKLAVSATMSMPNVGVSEEAVSLMAAALNTGLPAGLADADKAYFANALVERLHEPTFNLGFTPSTDYRVDRLGVQGNTGGAELIEGTHYCPGMPTALKNATKDLVQGVIDDDTFHMRQKERVHFEIRAKEKPDAKGRVPMMCPALGASPTVTCPLREMLKTATKKPRPAIAEEDLPTFADKICKQHSVAFTKDDGIRQKQAFPYKSKEWETFHRYARNSIESLNAGIKDLGRESIEDSSRRRVRGFAAAQVFVTILLTNYNLRKIASFMFKEKVAEAKKNAGLAPTEPATRRRRDREWYNVYTKTTPPGMNPPVGKETVATLTRLRT
jgi:hypothetical protein